MRDNVGGGKFDNLEKINATHGLVPLVGQHLSSSFCNSMPDNENLDEIQKQLDNLEKKHRTKCVIDQHGTAYICAEGGKALFAVYNDGDRTIGRYGDFTLEQVAYFKVDQVLAITPHTFLVKFSDQSYSYVTAEKSSVLESDVGDSLRKAALTRNYPQRLHGLSKVRSNGEFDFTLITKEGTVPIHSLVFKACMPFFATMMDSKMSESSEKKLEIPYPLSWVEAMVSYFYGEPFEVEFEQATGLLILADVYDIAELQRLAIARIKSERLDMTKCLAGWKNAFEAQNEEMRAYFASFARNQWDELEQSAEFLRDLSQEEAVELMLDVSRAKLGEVKLK